MLDGIKEGFGQRSMLWQSQISEIYDNPMWMMEWQMYLCSSIYLSLPIDRCLAISTDYTYYISVQV